MSTIEELLAEGGNLTWVAFDTTSTDGHLFHVWVFPWVRWLVMAQLGLSAIRRK
ncbi:hypothetical protein [Streptomyces erythrochromogenes]|uniref:hypothetical protein n=1 Tax=Streptomyces erythrochromogenes TaxID=285574 RepID=UPI0033CCF73C